MENNLSTGLQDVSAYCKDGKFFLEITIHEKDSKGDIHEIKINGIRLDLVKYAKYVVNRCIDPYICDFIPVSRHVINTGSHEYQLSNDSTTTDKIIHRHTERYTMEELEKKLGCHLEIVTNKENE